jgi:DNA invertase Pin-like site-specific DNA recombinase
MDEPAASSTAHAPIPAVIYAAKSTEDERGSIDTQITDATAMAEREGWSVAGTYSDENASAYHGNRGDGLAQAREHAERLAAEHGECMLVVQHTDRLSRGDGVQAQHLVEVILWAMNARVRVRSCQDDRTGESVLDAALTGTRNHEDSERKAKATAAGRRRAAERGEWCGNVPDGYDVERTAHGASILRRVVVHPERRDVYRLLWDLALDGTTVNDIVRQLAAKGYRTAPLRAKPKPFDATRVGKVITNPFYAGLMVSKRKIIGAGAWEPYAQPDDWYRLRRERSERARHRPQPVGRPPTSLLARLAQCECGRAMVEQKGGQRKDGSRRRTYVCVTHMHRRDDCSAQPFDAEAVERIILGGLDRLLGDAGAWADALLTSHRAERARLDAMVAEAAKEAGECERVIEKLIEQFDAATAEGDQGKAELAQGAWDRRRQIAERAALRQKAAEDALAAQGNEPEQDADVALARMWESLSGELHAVKDERAALNAALRRWFERFELRRDTDDGSVRIVPVLSADAADHLVGEMRQGSRSLGPHFMVVATPPWEEPEGRVIGYDIDPEIAGQPLGKGRWTISVTTDELTAETSDQPGKQHQSHLPHNTRPGSSRGTAGGSPRRSRTGQPARARL